MAELRSELAWLVEDYCTLQDVVENDRGWGQESRQQTDKDKDRAEAILKLADWQSIDTAPKDGTTIDLWVNGDRAANCFWFLGWEPIDEDDKPHWRQRYSEAPGSSEPLDAEPTHWMPLPPAPIA
jgi:hypothetical protein